MQTYILEIRGEKSDSFGDLSKEIAKELNFESLSLPIGTYIRVYKATQKIKSSIVGLPVSSGNALIKHRRKKYGK